MHDDAAPFATRWSPWAIASLPMSLVMCAPAAGTGALLAAIGLVQIRRSGGRMRGRGVARVAIAIAVVAIALQGVLLAWWSRNVRAPMLTGPLAPLQAGLDGDVEGFRAAFDEPGDLDETVRFLEAVGARWGDLVAIEQDRFAPPAATPAPASLPTIPYRFTFTGGETTGAATFRTFAPSSGLPRPVLRWTHLRVLDETGEALEYPLGDRAGNPRP